MSTIASQITSRTIVYSRVYSGADQRKHQSSALLAVVQGIHRRLVNSPHKWPVTRKIFPFDDVIMAMGWPVDMEPKECESSIHDHDSDFWVTMMRWVDIPDSNWGNFRHLHAVDISSLSPCTHVSFITLYLVYITPVYQSQFSWADKVTCRLYTNV